MMKHVGVCFARVWRITSVFNTEKFDIATKAPKTLRFTKTTLGLGPDLVHVCIP
jgi:hypothetical protein